MTDESEEGAVKEGADGDKRMDILLAVEPLSRRDFVGCLQLVHLLGWASWCQPCLQGCLVPPRSLEQPCAATACWDCVCVKSWE